MSYTETSTEILKTGYINFKFKAIKQNWFYDNW